MVRVAVRLFASYREAVGSSEIRLDLADGARASDAWSALVADHPRLARLPAPAGFAIDDEYVPGDAMLRHGQSLFLIPPVSGGAARTWITTSPLSADEVLRAVADPLAGAVVLFLGVVRQNAAGARVRHLEYEVYEPLALKEMARIADEAIARVGVLHVAIAHRTGHVVVGEASVMVAASSAHRPEAFAACRYCIDMLKQTVPIWKKEVWDAGEAWVGVDATTDEPGG